MEVWKVDMRSLALELTSLRPSFERSAPLFTPDSSAFRFKGINEPAVDEQDEPSDGWREAGLEIMSSPQSFFFLEPFTLLVLAHLSHIIM